MTMVAIIRETSIAGLSFVESFSNYRLFFWRTVGLHSLESNGMLYISTANALVANGLSKLGYTYINIGETTIPKLTLVS